MATVNDIQGLIRELSESDFREVMYWTVSTEKRRRESAVAVNAARLQMVREARIADPDVAPPVGEAWREPANVLGAYLPGETAEHREVLWGLSGAAPSMDEPGECPEWVQVPPVIDEVAVSDDEILAGDELISEPVAPEPEGEDLVPLP